MNVFSWLLGHAADFKALFDLEEKCRADYPATTGSGQLIAWVIGHKSDFVAAEQLVVKILSDRPQPAPTPTPIPGPLKALADAHADGTLQAKLQAEAAKLPAFNGQLLAWLLANAPQIIAFVTQIINFFHPTPVPAPTP